MLLDIKISPEEAMTTLRTRDTIVENTRKPRVSALHVEAGTYAYARVNRRFLLRTRA